MAVQQLDFDVRLATNSLQTIAIGEQFQPKCAVLDIGIPKFNGFETAKQVRNKPR